MLPLIRNRCFNPKIEITRKFINCSESEPSHWYETLFGFLHPCGLGIEHMKLELVFTDNEGSQSTVDLCCFQSITQIGFKTFVYEIRDSHVYHKLEFDVRRSQAFAVLHSKFLVS